MNNNNTVIADYLIKQAGLFGLLGKGGKAAYNFGRLLVQDYVPALRKANKPRPGFVPGQGVPVEKVSEGLYSGGSKIPMPQPRPKYVGPNQPRPGFVPGQGTPITDGFPYPVKGNRPRPGFIPGQGVPIDEIRNQLYSQIKRPQHVDWFGPIGDKRHMLNQHNESIRPWDWQDVSPNVKRPGAKPALNIPIGKPN